MSNLYLQMGMNLSIVLGLALVLLVILKRVRRAAPNRKQPLKLMHTLHLGSKEKIALVEVNGTMLVIGITPTQISRLHRFPAQMEDFTHLLQKTRETVSG